MKRRAFLASTLFGQTLQRRPNIIWIVADDMGYTEIGIQGCTDIPTPNIDSIAKNGIRFTSGYVSCPVCSPTRAGLMTGRYQQRFGHEFNPVQAEAVEPAFGLPLKEVTIADRLKSHGYVTGIVGKWHLGYQPEMHPTKRGFDEFFGFLAGAHAYQGGRPSDAENPILRGTTPIEEKAYLTDAFAREATAFIERNHEQKFFLYLAFNAVHNPLQASEKYMARFAKISDERRRKYAAMTSGMDDAVGAVLAKLREHHLEDDTLIIFHSDNGGPTAQTTSKNTPLRGYKGSTWEGGIRVPFLMQWKRHLPKGVVYNKPVITLDLHPTAIAAAGGSPPAHLDGVNLLPFLSGQNTGLPHQALYWRFGAQWAIRKGDWKLTHANAETQLFLLSQDLGESKDLANSQREVAKDLQDTWNAWNAQLAEPLWGRGGRGNGDGNGGKKKKKKQ